MTTTTDPTARTRVVDGVEVIGRADRGVARFLGLRYAEAERFGTPRPIEPSTLAGESDGRVLATSPSPACPQDGAPVLDLLIVGANRELPRSEHCQFLSVTTPDDVEPGERLPVMVWLHGGSFTAGAGDLDMFDPRDLVVEQRVIVVAVTYRLGLFGWLGDGETIPANLGLLDLVEALRWVREYITAFGGDPDAVTLFGQSAGAHAIAHLMISDGAEGLFRRAIVQSAPLGLVWQKDDMVRAMLAAAGDPVAETDPDPERILERQRAAAEVARRFGPKGFMPYGPQLGRAPLPAETDAVAAWRRAAPGVELLIGSTSEEAAIVLPTLPRFLRATRFPLVGRLLRWAFVRPSTQLIYRRQARRFAARHADAGGRVVRYHLDFRPVGTDVGAVHSVDVPLLLGPRDTWVRTVLIGEQGWPEAERIGRGLRQVWAEFARTGRVASDVDAGLRDVIRFDRPRRRRGRR